VWKLEVPDLMFNLSPIIVLVKDMHVTWFAAILNVLDETGIHEEDIFVLFCLSNAWRDPYFVEPLTHANAVAKTWDPVEYVYMPLLWDVPE
jgi:hypothetical protein